MRLSAISTSTGLPEVVTSTGGVLNVSSTSASQPSGSPSSGAPGSAAPSYAQLVAGTDTVNLRSLLTDTFGRLNVNNLGTLGVARQITATSSNTNTVLTTTVNRISISCRFADCRFAIGTGAQTANASTSHYIALGERLDISVPLNAQIAIIRDSAATVNGQIELSELV